MAVKTVPISGATIVVPGVLYLGGPCAGLHRSRLAQSVPVGVLSSAWVVSKVLHLSPNIPASRPTRLKGCDLLAFDVIISMSQYRPIGKVMACYVYPN